MKNAASIAVKHMEHEKRLADALRDYLASRDKAVSAVLWRRYADLHGQRAAARVRQMEVERGLA